MIATLKTTLRRTPRLLSALVTRVALAALVVVALAAPAGAAPVLADDQYKWFYWLGVLLGLSLIAAIVGVSLGYVKRVMIPKYRGRKVQ